MFSAMSRLSNDARLRQVQRTGGVLTREVETHQGINDRCGVIFDQENMADSTILSWKISRIEPFYYGRYDYS